MRLELHRKPSTKKNTQGMLFLNGEPECCTLEDPVREEKIYSETAIPFGEYEIDMTYSPAFGAFLPLLKNVPNFTGIRIHAGNSEVDTAGCILVGEQLVFGRLWHSKRALGKLIYKISSVHGSEPVTILIKQAQNV